VGQFGDKFRKAREAKNISLDDVSNVTKISSRMLQAIEQEHFDQLPGGVFNKGFIRAYAKHLGLNDEDAVTDYLACLRQAQVDAHEVWDPAPQPVSAPAERRPIAPYRKPTLRVQPAGEFDELPDLQLPRAEDVHPPKKEFLSDRRSGTPWSIVAVTAVILVLAIILWARHSLGARPHAASSPPKPVPTAQSAPVRATAVTAANPAPAKPTSAKSSPAKISPTNSSTNATATATQSRPPQPAPSTSPTITANFVATTPVKPPSASPGKDVIPRTLPLATPAAATPAPVTTAPSTPAATPAAAPMTLVIRANETSWIAVTADGQPVSQETLIAPVHTSFRATRQIIARIGNAAGVTFVWNGQEIPAQGAEFEVKTFLFDASGMRILPSPQPATQNQ
jgi:cytoskeletal protein RodZ